jgi:glycosyltransferase involved in cell wall biosynthesis
MRIGERKISVIIPSYNRVQVLGRAINSVLAQTFQDFEIIVVDDGSTDHTGDFIRKIQADNPQIVIRYFFQQNQGPAAARNLGIEKSSGEYIAFLDSDDEWVPQKLERQIACLEAQAEKDRVGIVFSDISYISRGIVKYEGFLKRDFYQHLFREDMNKMTTFLKNCYILTSTVMIPKLVLNTVGMFDAEYHIAEDYDLFIRIFKKYTFVFLPEPLVKRHMDGDNLMRHSEKYYQNSILLFSRLCDDDSFSETEKNVIKQRLKGFYCALGYYYFDQRKFKNAKDFLRKALRSREFLKVGYCLILASLPEKMFWFLKNLKNRCSWPRKTNER